MGTLEAPSPAPLLRKSFTLDKEPESASLLITGIGFYRLFVNGLELTRGHLSPYVSDPGLIVAFDKYDIAPYLTEGENVIGVILGAGFRGNFVGGYRTSLAMGDPLLGLVCDIVGEIFEADESLRVHSSPILMNDLRVGEVRIWSDGGDFDLV